LLDKVIILARQARIRHASPPSDLSRPRNPSPSPKPTLAI
jgi:hypothetical protein